MISVEELIFEYKDSKRGLEEMLLRLDPEHPQAEMDKGHINSMIRGIKETIEWMETGRDPQAYRGADKRFVYDGNEVIATISSYDDEVLPMLDIYDDEEQDLSGRELTNEEKQAITQAIGVLSIREKQCFMLHTVCQWSHGRIADKLGVKRASVQQFIRRAQHKVKFSIDAQ
ncbi:sigma factor-like helix-turn-helix DNA-binding protein [Rummeliibacillus sp. JY-2-4R]